MKSKQQTSIYEADLFLITFESASEEKIGFVSLFLLYIKCTGPKIPKGIFIEQCNKVSSMSSKP